jgi:hypothetical protein
VVSAGRHPKNSINKALESLDESRFERTSILTRRDPMTICEFTVYLDRALVDEDYDKLFDAGLDDTTPGMQAGRGILDVSREAPSLIDAIVSVATDAEAAGFAIVGVEENDLVSLKTVAERTGRSYEGVRLMALGRRGPGSFPAPLSGDGWSLYSWADVAAWFSAGFGTALGVSEHDRIMAAAGHVLRARGLVSGAELSALIALARLSPRRAAAQALDL